MDKNNMSKLDIKLDANSNMKWSVGANVKNASKLMYDIDIKMDDSKSNEVKTAKFAFNGKEQKYIMLPYDEALKVLMSNGYLMNDGGKLSFTKQWINQAKK
eukprot:15609_1